MRALDYIAATVEPVSRDWETTLASYYTWIANDVRRAGIRFHEYRDDFHGFTKMELLSGSKSAVVVIGGDSVEIELNVPGHGRTRDTYYKRYPSLHVFNRAAAQGAADAIKKFFHGAVTATVEPTAPKHVYKSVTEIAHHVHTGELKLPDHVMIKGHRYSVVVNSGLWNIVLMGGDHCMYQFDGATLDQDVGDEDADYPDWDTLHENGGKILVAEINKNPRTGLHTAVKKLEACFD